MSRHNRLWWVVIALGAMLAPSSAHAVDETLLPRDSWFIISIGGTECGWLHERVEVSGDRVQTFNEMRMTIGRAGATSTVQAMWRFVEAGDGTPVECIVEQDSGAEKSRAKYRFSPSEVVVEESAGGRTKSRVMESPTGKWLTPGQVERHVNAKRKEGATEIRYTTVDPSSGMSVVEMTSTRIGEGEGQTTRWRTANSAVALLTEEDVDATGRIVISRTKIALGDMVARIATESRAKKAGVGGTIDLIDRSMVSLTKPVPELLLAKHARLAVRSSDAGALSLPDAGAQRITTNPAGGLFADIESGRSSPATPEDLADSRYLASTILIDADDPAVKSLATRALKSAGLVESSATNERAEALRAFVMRYIVHKDLATAFAGASAVAKSKAGDCSEHAILLAGLLRAQHIPARVASGLVYAEEFGGRRNVFAWHMWTQAQIEGAWVDLDATLASSLFHPGHLLIATSAQDDAQLDSDFSALLGTIGNISIEVVDVDR